MADGLWEIPLKGGGVFKVDPAVLQGDDFPPEVYAQLLRDGLQVRLNGGMSKFKVKDLSEEEMVGAKEAIAAKAQENWEALCEGKIKTTRKGASKIPGAVKTRAMQIAKAIVKDLIRKEGHKVSAYKAAEIKEMAEELLGGHPEIIEQASEELAAMSKKGEETKIALPEKFKNDSSRKAKPRGKPTAALAAAARKRGETKQASARH